MPINNSLPLNLILKNFPMYEVNPNFEKLKVYQAGQIKSNLTKVAIKQNKKLLSHFRHFGAT